MFCGQCGKRLFISPGPQSHVQAIPQIGPSRDFTPGRGLFLPGAGGSFLVGIAAAFLGIIATMILLGGSGVTFRSSTIYVLIIVLSFLFFMGSIIKSIGYIGFYRNYGSPFGLVAFVLGIIAPIFFIMLTFAGIKLVYTGYYYIGLLVWVGHIIVGIMLLTMGISLLSVSNCTGMKGISLATGTLVTTAGGMLIALLGFVGAAWFVLSVAEFLAGLIFAKAHLPITHKQPPIAQPSIA